MNSEKLPRAIESLARLSFLHGITTAFGSLGFSQSAIDEYDAIWEERNPGMPRDSIAKIADSAEMLRVSERMEHELVTCFRELLKRRAPGLFEETP